MFGGKHAQNAPQFSCVQSRRSCELIDVNTLRSIQEKVRDLSFSHDEEASWFLMLSAYQPQFDCNCYTENLRTSSDFYKTGQNETGRNAWSNSH